VIENLITAFLTRRKRPRVAGVDYGPWIRRPGCLRMERLQKGPVFARHILLTVHVYYRRQRLGQLVSFRRCGKLRLAAGARNRGPLRRWWGRKWERASCAGAGPEEFSELPLQPPAGNLHKRLVRPHVLLVAGFGLGKRAPRYCAGRPAVARGGAGLVTIGYTGARRLATVCRGRRAEYMTEALPATGLPVQLLRRRGAARGVSRRCPARHDGVGNRAGNRERIRKNAGICVRSVVGHADLPIARLDGGRVERFSGGGRRRFLFASQIGAPGDDPRIARRNGGAASAVFATPPEVAGGPHFRIATEFAGKVERRGRAEGISPSVGRRAETADVIREYNRKNAGVGEGADPADGFKTGLLAALIAQFWHNRNLYRVVALGVLSARPLPAELVSAESDESGGCLWAGAVARKPIPAAPATIAAGAAGAWAEEG